MVGGYLTHHRGGGEAADSRWVEGCGPSQQEERGIARPSHHGISSELTISSNNYENLLIELLADFFITSKAIPTTSVPERRNWVLIFSHTKDTAARRRI